MCGALDTIDRVFVCVQWKIGVDSDNHDKMTQYQMKSSAFERPIANGQRKHYCHTQNGFL